MIKTSTQILKSFQKELSVLEQMRKKQEGLFIEGNITRRDIEEVYSAIFINALVSFENLIESLFIGLLIEKIQHRKNSQVNPKVKIKSSKTARELLFYPRRYFNWLPYGNTKKIANVYFTGGRPFTFIENDKIKHIEKCFSIRNCLAHQSDYSKRIFK